jgi:molybdopterin converting factor small subunit
MSEKISVTVSFFSTLRNTTGIAQIQISISLGDDLLSILQTVEKQYFQPKSARLLNNNGLGLEAGILCLIDDADMSLSGGLHQKIKTPATITLISSLHGG